MGGDYKKHFYIRFTENANIDPDMIISGRIHVKIDGMSLGLEKVAYYSPLGLKVRNGRPQISKSTDVKIDFSFNLAYLRLWRNIGC